MQKYSCRKCGSTKVKVKLTKYGVFKECENCGNFEASTTREVLRFKKENSLT